MMNEQPIHVLLIEASPADARLINELLANIDGESIAVEWIDRLSAALARPPQRQVDVILLDLSLPDSQGLATLAAIQAHAPTVPILIVTGLDDQALALQAMRSGAQDYLLKRRLDEYALGRAIRYAIARKQAEERLLKVEEHLGRL